MGPPRTVRVDPASAGLDRKERPGWALGFAALGSVVMVGALFVDHWAKVQYYDISTIATGFESVDEWPGIFSALDTVEEVRGPDSSAPDPGWFAELFFPWLAIALTAACCLVAFVAAFGLRRTALTTTARAAAVTLVVATAAVAALAFVSLGWNITGDDADRADPSSPPAATPGGAEQEPEPDSIGSKVQPEAAVTVWMLGGLFLVVAGLLGPRIVHSLPPGARATSYGGQPAYGGPAGHTGYAGHLGQVAGPGPSHGVLRHTTQLVSVVVASVAAVLCVAGYGFLSWAQTTESVTFSDLSESARDPGFGDKGFAEAYFAWLGWAALVVVLVAALLIALAKFASGVNAKILRPFLAVGSIAAALAHVGALIDLGGSDYGVGVYAVGVGLALLALAAVLPLRTTAEVVYQ